MAQRAKTTDNVLIRFESLKEDIRTDKDLGDVDISFTNHFWEKSLENAAFASEFLDTRPSN